MRIIYIPNRDVSILMIIVLHKIVLYLLKKQLIFYSLKCCQTDEKYLKKINYSREI